MRTIQFGTAIALFCLSAATARGDIEASVNIDNSGIREFHLAIGEFYNVPQTDIELIKSRKIEDEELPVVFFLAKRARVTPTTISELKLGGKTWIDITHYFGMGADIFYVKAGPVSAPPYGKALGYYKNKKKSQWRYIKLSDEDIVNLVNLQFIVAKYNYSPDSVIKLRCGGKDFMAINKDFKEGKIGKPEKSPGNPSALKSKGHPKHKR